MAALIIWLLTVAAIGFFVVFTALRRAQSTGHHSSTMFTRRQHAKQRARLATPVRSADERLNAKSRTRLRLPGATPGRVRPVRAFGGASAANTSAHMAPAAPAANPVQASPMEPVGSGAAQAVDAQAVDAQALAAQTVDAQAVAADRVIDARTRWARDSKRAEYEQRTHATPAGHKVDHLRRAE